VSNVVFAENPEPVETTLRRFGTLSCCAVLQPLQHGKQCRVLFDGWFELVIQVSTAQQPCT
jgi:hypothetical protein